MLTSNPLSGAVPPIVVFFFYRAVRSEGTRETAAYFGPRDLWPKLNLCSAIFLPECCTPLPCNKTRLRSHPVAFYSDSRSRTKSLQLDSLLLGQFSNNSSDSSNSPRRRHRRRRRPPSQACNHALAQAADLLQPVTGHHRSSRSLFHRYVPATGPQHAPTELLYVVVGPWLDNIRHDPKAFTWWKENLALDKVSTGALSAHGSIKLLSGRPANAPPSSTQRHLYFSAKQVDMIRSLLGSKGVNKTFVRASFEAKWMFDSDKLDLKTLLFTSGKQILAFRQAHSSPTLPSPTASPAGSRSSTPLSFPAISAKRPLLPTPCTSVESSPEPSSALKKLKSKHTPEGIERRVQAELVGAETQKEELRTMREVYAKAKREGGAAFLALDIETWERSHGYLLEFGWTFVDFEKRENGVGIRREDQHVSESPFCGPTRYEQRANCMSQSYKSTSAVATANSPPTRATCVPPLRSPSPANPPPSTSTLAVPSPSPNRPSSPSSTPSLKPSPRPPRSSSSSTTLAPTYALSNN